MKNNTNLSKPKQKMRCPQCSNYVEVTKYPKGGIYGNCPVCKVTFYSKEHPPKERLIRIIKH